MGDVRKGIAAVVLVALGLVLAGCGSTTVVSDDGSGSSGIATSDATTFWRQQVGSHYNGPVASGDGRGCAEQSATKFICTAYVRKPNVDTDVYGTVTISGGNMTVNAHLAHGNQIQNWFTQTGGGCNRSSCSGVKFR